MINVLTSIIIWPVALVFWILLTIGDTIELIVKLVKNIFEKKCDKKTDEIIAIKYNRSCIPWSLIDFTIHKEDMRSADFEEIINAIKLNRLLEQKTYIINRPFHSPIWVYRFFTYIDWGPRANQRISLIFEDGTHKDIVGFSQKMDNVVDTMKRVLPEEMFDE